MATSSVRNFAKTLDDPGRIGKIGMREKCLELVDQAYDNHHVDRQFKMITLASMQWIFEKALLKHVYDNYADQLPRKRGLSMKSFEYDWKLFCVAAINMPSGKHSKIEQKLSEHNYQVIQSNVSTHLVSVHNIDVFDYLRITDNQFDFMWLDLTSPLDFVQEKIKAISSHMHPGAMLILSFSKGRERIKIADRTAFAREILHDLEYIETVEYMDTVAMMNIIFKKPQSFNPEDYIEY